MDERTSYEIPLGRLLRVAPGLPTTDMARTVEHYARLGFRFSAPGAAPVADAEFAIAERDGIGLHFALKPDHDPARTATWVYIGVEDADQLAAEFRAAGAGQAREVRNTDYKMRELGHIDPDGNLLLFGSPLPDAGAPAAAPAPGAAGSPEAGAGAASDPRVFEFAAAVKSGDVDRVRGMLAGDPALATAIINSCRPLHLFADAPGHRPNAAGIVTALVQAGADLDAHAIGTWHHETALHWAASNDDVELIDVLLDAGADIEHPGSSINGGPPAASALGYAQWAALRRLYERGAKTGLSHAAALGLMPIVTSLAEVSPAPPQEELSVAFWNACRAGQLATARYLAGRGADLSWPAPWSGETPLDAARDKHQREVAAWLTEAGGRPGS
jgi:predicted enzyme related to lactoylglutathione lyase